jgi:hypothetical protein
MTFDEPAAARADARVAGVGAIEVFHDGHRLHAKSATNFGEVGVAHLPHGPIELQFFDRAQHQGLVLF